MSKHGENMADVPDEFVFDNPGEAVSKAEEMGLEGSGDEIIHTHGDGDETVFMPAPSHEELLSMLEDMESMGVAAPNGEDQQNDDGTHGGKSPSSAANSETTTMSENDLTETEQAVLAAAEGLESPAEALEKYAAAEQPTVVESDEYESLKENVESVRGVMEDALCERTDLKKETVEALDFEALRAEFETEDGELDAEALVQSPESQQPDPTDAEALSDEANVEKAEALYQDYQSDLLSGTDRLEEDIVDALGVDDFETAEEVLN
jgi:hypothetical protein